MLQTFQVLCKKHRLLKLFLRCQSTSSKLLIEKNQVNKDVKSYLENCKEYKDIIDNIPKDLIKISKKPESIYLINKKAAQEIVKILSRHIDRQSPIVEFNPGFGFVTTEMLKSFDNFLYLFEISPYFSKYLNEIEKLYPERIKIKYQDFLEVPKLLYYDKNDEQNKVKTILGDLATDEKDRAVTVVGTLPNTKFLVFLIMDIIFHYSIAKLGKPDFYFLMSEQTLECVRYDAVGRIKKTKGWLNLAPILFDVKPLAKIPDVNYLPWLTKTTKKNYDHSFYLVHIKVKDEMPVPPSYLPLLWYFFRRNTFTNNTRVLPLLEQWMPGCGVWFICDRYPPDANPELMEDEPLPHINIFSIFGDFTVKQQISIFKRFVSLPEFEQSAYRSMVESCLPKYATIGDNNKSTRGSDHDHDYDQDAEADENDMDADDKNY